MKIKLPEFEIPEDRPFANDLLHREESAIILTQLMSTIEQPFVLAIDSSWGTGKTVFLKMWKQYLKNSGFRVLYFNAWVADFAEDPFIALVGEIESQIDEIESNIEQRGKIKAIFSDVKSKALPYAKNAFPLLVKIATSGLMDFSNIKREDIDKFAENLTREKIEEYEKTKNSINKFKDNLLEFVKELSGEKPVIFFIDELDRCRPNFTVSLLEKIKHLFDIPGLIFVLAIDKEQIIHSVRCLYGAEMNSDGYLRRFIDLDYQLPGIPEGVYVMALFSKYDIDKLFEHAKGNREYVIACLECFFDMFDFTLRQQEQIISRLSIVIRLIDVRAKYVGLMCFLISLKSANNDLYRKFISSEGNYPEVLDFLDDKSRKHHDKVLLGDICAQIILSNCLNDVDRETAFLNVDSNMSKAQKKEEKERLAAIKYQMESKIRNDYPSNVIDNITKKIELAERFR